MDVGLTKMLVIGLVALFVIGPDRLPEYAARLGRLVRTGRRMLDDAKVRVRDELGEDFDEEQWRKLDPRQYDPRRIIRDALLEPPEPHHAVPAPVHVTRDGTVVYDDEAT